MRWILDACTLIYLVKTNLLEDLISLEKYQLIIDTSVYQEVIIDGKANNYSDAYKAEKILKKFKIPIISIDVKDDLNLFRNAGETSCYILAKEDGVCITSDIRAYRKIHNKGQKVIRLDSFYFQKFKEGLLTEHRFITYLKKLEYINAITPKSILFFKEKIEKIKEVGKKND